MNRPGMISEEARYLLVSMARSRSSMDWLFKGFADNKIRQMQSINRRLEEYFEMAAKAKNKIAAQPKEREAFQWKGFIDAKLDDNDKANYAAWDVADNDIWDGIAQYCEAGIKVAITYNAQNASFTCSGTGQPASGANSGYCVNAYAKSPYEAARVWLFKVATMLPAIWTEYDAGEADSFG